MFNSKVFHQCTGNKMNMYFNNSFVSIKQRIELQATSNPDIVREFQQILRDTEPQMAAAR